MDSNATQIHHHSCSKCDHLIKVQMHKVLLNNLWIWLYSGIIKAKLEAKGQSRSQGRDFLHILIQSASQSLDRAGAVHGQPMDPVELIHQTLNSKGRGSLMIKPDFLPPKPINKGLYSSHKEELQSRYTSALENTYKQHTLTHTLLYHESQWVHSMTSVSTVGLLKQAQSL